jgi:polysaccharide export outer membrane protein
MESVAISTGSPRRLSSGRLLRWPVLLSLAACIAALPGNRLSPVAAGDHAGLVQHWPDASGTEYRRDASATRETQSLLPVGHAKQAKPDSKPLRHETVHFVTPEEFQLCQSLGPAAPCSPPYVDCYSGSCRLEPWNPSREMPWQVYAQGEYVGHYRTPHVPEYRLRVDDLLDCVYRLTREESYGPYKLEVGDTIRLESFSDPNLNREEVLIQPDGMVTMRLLGEVRAAGRTIMELRDELDRLYAKYYKDPSITITPVKINTKLEDLRSAVVAVFSFGGQVRQARVTPDGTIALPAIGSIPAQGLTLDELKLELDARYNEVVPGVEVTPVLLQRAPRSIYVLGEVQTPGRYELVGPTTLMQAVALAGGWNVGANLKQIVVFRRGDDWRLMATRIDMWGPLRRGDRPCPQGEIWLNDSDIVLIPKLSTQIADEWIDMIFTRGLYGVVPFQYTINMAKLSSL